MNHMLRQRPEDVSHLGTEKPIRQDIRPDSVEAPVAVVGPSVLRPPP